MDPQGESSDEEEGRTSCALVYWVNEKKVSCIPVTAISEANRYVGALVKIKLPKTQKDHMARVEFISDDLEELEKKEDEIIKRIDDEEAEKLSHKRQSRQPVKFGHKASEQALEVATGVRRKVPETLVRAKKQSTEANKKVAANKKAAQDKLENEMLQVVEKPLGKSADVPFPKPTKNRKKQVDNPLEQRATSPKKASQKQTTPQKHFTSKKQTTPQKQIVHASNPESEDVMDVDVQIEDKNDDKEESIEDLTLSVIEPKERKKIDATLSASESSDLDANFENFRDKKFFRKCQRLKRQFTPPVKIFLRNVLESFDCDSSSEDDVNSDFDSEKKFVDVIAPKDNESQVELRKGCGVFIASNARRVILLTGSKQGPQKLLTELIHELFRHRLKEIHGTSTIRQHVLKAIFGFVTASTPDHTAISKKDMKRTINRLASEARRGAKSKSENQTSPRKRKRSKGKKQSSVPCDPPASQDALTTEQPEKHCTPNLQMTSPAKAKMSWTVAPQEQGFFSMEAGSRAQNLHGQQQFYGNQQETQPTYFQYQQGNYGQQQNYFSEHRNEFYPQQQHQHQFQGVQHHGENMQAETSNASQSECSTFLSSLAAWDPRTAYRRNLTQLL